MSFTAIEFFQKFGIKTVENRIKLLEQATTLNVGHECNENDLNMLQQLKGLVVSWELVQSWGGLKHCKHLIQGCEQFRTEKIGSKSHDLDKTTTYNELKQAIADVEAIGELKQ